MKVQPFFDSCKKHKGKIMLTESHIKVLSKILLSTVDHDHSLCLPTAWFNFYNIILLEEYGFIVILFESNDYIFFLFNQNWTKESAYCLLENC